MCTETISNSWLQINFNKFSETKHFQLKYQHEEKNHFTIYLNFVFFNQIQKSFHSILFWLCIVSEREKLSQFVFFSLNSNETILLERDTEKTSFSNVQYSQRNSYLYKRFLSHLFFIFSLKTMCILCYSPRRKNFDVKYQFCFNRQLKCVGNIKI